MKLEIYGVMYEILQDHTGKILKADPLGEETEESRAEVKRYSDLRAKKTRYKKPKGGKK